MTMHDEYARQARILEADGIIRVEFGTVMYRGSEYISPVAVTILDFEGFNNAYNNTKAEVDAWSEKSKNGVYGAGTEAANAQFRLQFMDNVRKGKYPMAKKAEVEEPKVQDSAIQEPQTSQASMGGLDILASVVAEAIAKTQGKEIQDRLAESAIEAVKEFIAKEYGPIVKKVWVEDPQGEKKPIEGVLHERFDEVLAFVEADEPVFLCGPAGAGKNVLCQQIAEALGLDFYFSNAVTQEYKITGFTDATGVYQPSQFYHAFKDGGLFMLDEMDASIPEVLIILNAAIANRYFDFPAPIGRVEAHPDFRVIAAGNTFGQGASFQYVGRNQLDGASLDRFAVIDVGYDERIELAMARDDKDLVRFVHDVRDVVDDKGIQLIVSYRTIGRIAKMKSKVGTARALKTCLFKGMDVEDVRNIYNELRAKEQTEYHKAVRELF